MGPQTNATADAECGRSRPPDDPGLTRKQGYLCLAAFPEARDTVLGMHPSITREVAKAHGSLSTALADAKADLAMAEATVESLVPAAKKAV